MEDTIDLPVEYFNKESTPLNEVEENGVYSLDVEERVGSPKKSPDQPEEEIQSSDTQQTKDNTQANQSNSTYNTVNNTDQFSTVNYITNGKDEQSFINDNKYSNVSNNNVDQVKEDINYNFFKDSGTEKVKPTQATNDNTPLRPSPSNDSIHEQIQSIDGKIGELTSKLDSINTDSKNSFNSFVENNTSQTSVNSDYSLDSDESSPVTVVPNLYYSEKQQIRNNIFTLNNQKSKLQGLLNNSYQNQVSNVNNSNVENTDTSLAALNTLNNKETVTNVTEEFSPNLINNTEKSLEKAIITEKVLGGEPKVVDSPTLGKVVIDERQGTLENAINEHGGIENAIRDSKQNQNMVENFYKENNSTENITNTSEGDSSVFNMDSLTPMDPTASEPVPDNNQIIAKDTSTILSVLNNITTQLSNISNNLSKLKMPSGSNSNFAANFYTSDGKSNTSKPAGNGHSTSAGKAPMKTGIKGNLPLGDFFPKDFNVESLGVSNLLSRI